MEPPRLMVDEHRQLGHSTLWTPIPAVAHMGGVIAFGYDLDAIDNYNKSFTYKLFDNIE